MKVRKYIVWIFTVLVVFLMITNAQNAIIYARNALSMCFEMIVPTLFPFFICAGILIYSGFCELMARLFRFCMYPLFKVAPAGSSAFVLGIVSGYPLGAVTAGELYANNYLSKSEAERLLAFCNNSGPLFILGSVGMAVYANLQFGIAMYITHNLAAITVGILFRFYGMNKHSSPPTKMNTHERNIGEIFDIALQNGIRSILTVCAAVVFFSVAARLIIDLLPLGETANALVSGLAEFVTGTVKIAALDIPVAKKLILTSAIVGFAGLSVHIQVMAVIARYNLSLAPYILGKVLHGFFAALYMTVYLHFNPLTQVVFRPSMSLAFASASAFEVVVSIIVVVSCLVYAVSYYVRFSKKRKNIVK